MDLSLSDGESVPLYSVLAAAVVLLCAAGVIVAVVRRQRYGPPRDRLGAILREIGDYEVELSREFAAGTFGAYADWVRDRAQLGRLDSELADLASTSGPGRAQQVSAVREALDLWRDAIDQAGRDPLRPIDPVTAAAERLRSAVAAAAAPS